MGRLSGEVAIGVLLGAFVGGMIVVASLLADCSRLLSWSSNISDDGLCPFIDMDVLDPNVLVTAVT